MRVRRNKCRAPAIVILLGGLCILSGCIPVLFGHPPYGVTFGQASLKFDDNNLRAAISSDSLGSAEFYVRIENRNCDKLRIPTAMIGIKTKTGVVMHIDSMTVSDEGEAVKTSPLYTNDIVLISIKKTRVISGWFNYPRSPVTPDVINNSGDLPLTLVVDSVGCTGSGQFRRIEITLSSEAQLFKYQ